MQRPQAEVITVGDEILLGRTINGNAAYLGRRLSECGVPVKWSSVCADQLDEIQAAVTLAMNRADVVIMSGGLGPTPDDLTRDAIAKLFDLPLVESAEQKTHVEAIFRNRGIPVPVQSLNQCIILGGADRLHNPLGTAAGFHLRRKEKHIFALPGVPPEMERMFDEQVEPILGSAFSTTRVFNRTLRMAGIGESILLGRLGDLDPLARRVDIAYLPHQGLLDVRLTSRSTDELEADADIAFAEHYIRERAGEHVYATGTTPLPQVIGDILLNRAQWLVTAESCTGGLLTSLLTDTPGASRWLERGWITYSNQAKITELSVEAAIIERHGAVSEEVVTQMAAGALADTGANWAVSISGIAGPDGGTPEKPVGTVWIAVASTEKVSAKRMQFGSAGQRELIKMRAAHYALFMLYRRLVEGS